MSPAVHILIFLLSPTFTIFAISMISNPSAKRVRLFSRPGKYVVPARSVNGQRQYDQWQSVTLIKKQRQKIRGTKPGSVAVNHGGLWIPRQQFESAPGYFLSQWFFHILKDLLSSGFCIHLSNQSREYAADEYGSECTGTAKTDRGYFEIFYTVKISDVSTQQNSCRPTHKCCYCRRKTRSRRQEVNLQEVR